MEVFFLVPDIHDLQTGGNVFNRRIIEGLRPETPVRVAAWGPDETPAPSRGRPDEGAIVVDSLLARRPDALRVLREEPPAAPLVLLVHYLRCLDPQAPETEGTTHERAALDEVDAAITTSHFVRRALRDEGMGAERVAVVRPGLDARYRGAPSLRLGCGPPRLLTVANLLPPKGLLSFVECLRGLRDLPWTWTLVGDASLDPSYAAKVFRRLRVTGLSDRVTWAGPIGSEALRAEYDRADLFVLPSRFETCSLSTREAMARGLPVVGYDTGGMAENFGDVAAGHLAPPADLKGLRDALRSLLTDPMARAQRGRRAWRRSHDFPTWDAAAGRFREALVALRSCVGGTAH